MAVNKLIQYYGTGRRKCSVARVFVRPGSGKFTINQKSLSDYFPEHTSWYAKACKALEVGEVQGKFDVYATVYGGGNTGQSDAISLGLARALVQYDEEGTSSNISTDESEEKGVFGMRRKMRAHGLLTRDSRIVERKKVGLPKARKAKQFSKR